MRGIRNSTVVLATLATFASFGCSASDAHRTARTPASLDAPGTTRTTSAALITSTKTSTTTITAGDPARTSAARTTTTAGAVMRIATERCDRAAACKQIGASRAFGDRDECVNAIGHDVVTSLSDEACPSGVDADRLAACASEVQTSSCDDGAKTAIPPSCARERLCQNNAARAAASRELAPGNDANANANDQPKERDPAAGAQTDVQTIR